MHRNQVECDQLDMCGHPAHLDIAQLAIEPQRLLSNGAGLMHDDIALFQRETPFPPERFPSANQGLVVPRVQRFEEQR